MHTVWYLDMFQEIGFIFLSFISSTFIFRFFYLHSMNANMDWKFYFYN